MGTLVQDPDLRNKSAVFHDRCDAGKKLAALLRREKIIKNAVICAIPSGGVPVGIEIARELSLPFTVLVVRKLQIPWNTEAGFGSMTWDGKVYLHKDLVDRISLSEGDIDRAVEITAASIRKRMDTYARYMKSLTRIAGKVVIVVDDGLASGYTMLAAIRSLQGLGPGRVVVAVPTGSVAAAETDIVICQNLVTGPSFAVANAYEHWHDLNECDVAAQLSRVEETGFF
jgi:putative phosphoribosyl transferase